MYNIQKEMRLLKEKVSEDELKRKRDEELKTLEKERDWFRNEALRLDKICKEYKRNIEIWKSKAQILEEDRKFMENQILIAKKQNLKLKEDIEFQKEFSLSAEKSWAKPDEKSKEVNATNNLELKSSKNISNTINHLKNQIQIQKKTLKLQKAVHASYFLEKGELEDFFINCIEEVKKDIIRRRSQNSNSNRLTYSVSAKSIQKADEVNLSEFTAGDKRKVIELLLSQDDVIRSIRTLIFPRNTERVQRPKTEKSYGLSHVFSSPVLHSNKNLVRPSTAPKGWN
jgi:hypothetical protein